MMDMVGNYSLATGYKRPLILFIRNCGKLVFYGHKLSYRSISNPHTTLPSIQRRIISGADTKTVRSLVEILSKLRSVFVSDSEHDSSDWRVVCRSELKLRTFFVSASEYGSPSGVESSVQTGAGTAREFGFYPAENHIRRGYENSPEFVIDKECYNLSKNEALRSVIKTNSVFYSWTTDRLLKLYVTYQIIRSSYSLLFLCLMVMLISFMFVTLFYLHVFTP